MLFAGKVIAIVGAQLMDNPALLAQATEEFESRTAASPYVCPIPKGVSPSY